MAGTAPSGSTPAQRRERAEARARLLLRRWGVIFRKLLERESEPWPWREIAFACRRMEARGEIRGGRFVGGFAGEQFALPEAVGTLRAVRKEGTTGRCVALSAADPLNLTGLITPETRVPAVTPNRVLYRDGSPIAALEAGAFRCITRVEESDKRDLERLLIRRPVPPTLRRVLRSHRTSLPGVPHSGRTA